jgi:diguanylate cyclase (GGDEF)-like protein/PAS domain S-box-containing protein
MYDVIDHTILFLWLATMLSITLFRVYKAGQFTNKVSQHSLRYWDTLFSAGVLVTSLLWGVTAFIFLPYGELFHQLTLTLVVAGIAAGAVSSLSANLNLIRLFIVISLLPLAIQFITIYPLMAGLIFLYILMLVVNAKNFHENIVKTIETRILYEQTNKDLQFSNHRFETIFQQAPIGIVYYDRSLTVIESNEAFLEILNTDEDHVERQPILEVLLGVTQHTFSTVFFNQDGSFEGSLSLKNSNDDIWVSVATSPLFDGENDVIGGVGIVSDITQRVRSEREIFRQAHYDELTALPNRSLLRERLTQTIKRVRRHQKIAALIFLDLNNFKTINDSLGHLVGDKLLQHVAMIIKTTVREEDTVARLGGDEFVVLLPEQDTSMQSLIVDVEKVAMKIDHYLKEPIEIDNRILHTSASMGIELLTAECESIEDALKHADLAMYQAKRSNKVMSFYDESMDQAIQKRLLIENELRQALTFNELVLHYQPLVDLQSDRVIGAEALVRWNHPVKGLIYPDEFIHVAEETGQIIDIGSWVMKEALTQFKHWHDEYPFFEKISINLSPKQFQEERFVDELKSLTRHLGVRAQHVDLELTESVMVDSVNETIEKMHTLKMLGFSLSIDDFGTGYSSLAYLKNLPFDTLKIDKSFIKNALDNESDAILVATMIHIAKNFNLHVIAEGVESEALTYYLRTQACDYYQGFYKSKPVTIEAFDQILQEQKV